MKEKNKVHTPYEEMNVVPSSGVHKMAFSKAKQFVFAVADKKVTLKENLWPLKLRWSTTRDGIFHKIF